MKGMMGLSGTDRPVGVMVIGWPALGGARFSNWTGIGVPLSSKSFSGMMLRLHRPVRAT
jgi:hypothetical protein